MRYFFRKFLPQKAKFNSMNLTNIQTGEAMSKIDCTIMLPCRNEEIAIGRCIEEALRYCAKSKYHIEILVADNRSHDKSIEIVKGFGVKLIHVEQIGYGRTISALAHEAQGEFLIMADADGSYDFRYIDEIIDHLKAGADLVIGNRFMIPMEEGAMPWLNRYIGNPFLSLLASKIFNICTIRDFHCGLRGFRKKTFMSWSLQCDGMEFASEMVVKMHLMKHKAVEIPIQYRKDFRQGQRSNLRIIRDGFRHLWYIISHGIKVNSQIL